jgi:hypothetical protein
LETWVIDDRRRAFALVYAASFCAGLTSESGGPLQVLAALTNASAIALWCALDARCHDKLFLRSYAWLMMFTWPVGVLAHAVWTRGARGVGFYAAALVAWFVAAAVGMGAATLLSGA